VRKGSSPKKRNLASIAAHFGEKIVAHRTGFPRSRCVPESGSASDRSTLVDGGRRPPRRPRGLVRPPGLSKVVLPQPWPLCPPDPRERMLDRHVGQIGFARICTTADVGRARFPCPRCQPGLEVEGRSGQHICQLSSGRSSRSSFSAMRRAPAPGCGLFVVPPRLAPDANVFGLLGRVPLALVLDPRPVPSARRASTSNWS